MWIRVRDAMILARLGERPVDGLKMAAAHLAFPIARRLKIVRRFGVRLGLGTTVWIEDDSELLVVKELLAESEYDLDGVPEPRTILDLGANVGIAALLFRRHFPNARIVCVEASPRTYGRLVANVASQEIETLNAAVMGARGTVSMTDGGSSWSNHVTSGGGVQVQALTLDDLIARFGADLIKIDIEGSEFEAVPASRLLQQASTLLGEVHPHAGDTHRFLADLEAQGWVQDRPLNRNSFRMMRAESVDQ